MDPHTASLLLLTLIHLILHVSARDYLSPGSSLSAEHNSDVLHSPDGTFTCGFYSISSNAATFSIWFSNSYNKTVVWSANLLRPVYTWGSKVKLNVDGSMILQDYKGQIVWTNNVSSSDTEQAQAQLLDTGNLIVKCKGDNILWQSFDSPSDTLLPTQKITAATKLVSSNRLLDAGLYSFRFDYQYLISLFYEEEDLSFIYWPDPAMDIWAKLRILFNTTTTGVLDSWGLLLASDNEIFRATDWGSGIMRRLTLDYDGNLRLYSLNEEDGTWYVTWMAFPRLCGVPGLCGSIYLKLPKGVEVSGSSIPQSQVFGPKYRPNCTTTNKYSKANHQFYFYLYGFLSAIFLAEVTFILFVWLILRREGRQLRGVCPPVARYEMITNHFRRYTYRELVTATRKFQEELGRGASGIVYC